MALAVGLIPARYGSTRFPGKSLELLRGLPVIVHVCKAASRARKLGDVYVATDDQRIYDTVVKHGFKAVMTRNDHTCGTDRLVEALTKLEKAPDIVVNIQGDEPLIDPAAIDLAVTALEESGCDWSTLKHRITAEEAMNPNKVKVVCAQNGEALYFSRSPIPFARDNYAAEYFGHVGLYCYKREALLKFAALPSSPLEKAEKLEQLRALENGMRIVCATISHAAPGIDTPEDLAYTEALLEARERGEK